MIILEQIGVKASGEKTWKIGAEREHHTEREELCQNIKESVVIRSEGRVRILVRIIADQPV